MKKKIIRSSSLSQLSSSQLVIEKRTKKIVIQQSESQQEIPFVKKSIKQHTKKQVVQSSDSQSSLEQEFNNNNQQQFNSSSQEQSEQIESNQEQQFQICVSGLNFSTTQNQIRKLFDPYGKPCGKSRGIAFVKFKDLDSMIQSLELNQTNQFDRIIKVVVSDEFDPAGKSNYTKNISNYYNNNTQIFVGNLSYSTTNQSLKSHFQSIGKVVSTSIPTNYTTKKSLGFGYVKFENFIDYSNSFSLNDSYLDGRPISVAPVQLNSNNQNNSLKYKKLQILIKSINLDKN